MKDTAAGQDERTFSELQQKRNQLYIDTVNAILDHLKKPRVESEDVGEAYEQAMAALKEEGFTYKASGKIIQQAEGILMTRYVEASISESSQTQASRVTGDDETAANTVQVKIFRVPSRKLDSHKEDSRAKEVSSATGVSPEAFLKGLFEKHLENIQKGQAPDHDKVLVESSITKQDYAGIRNLRVHQYSGENGVQNIHAHAYILGNDNYEQNLKHLYAQCQPSLKGYHLFFQEATAEAADKAAAKAASDAGIFNVSLIDGADGGFLSRPLNRWKSDDEFKMAAKAAEARSEARSEAELGFNFESVNSTVNDYFQSGVSLSGDVIEAAKKAIAAIEAKIGKVDDANKEALADAYNQMNSAMLGVAKLDGHVTEATAENIKKLLENRTKEISDLQTIYKGLQQLPRDMQIALKPALEAMIMSRCGYGVSLGCKSGKDRTFIVMCMIGALEKNLASVNDSEFLCGPGFAMAVKDEAMDPSGREIAEGNCDGAFGTKSGSRLMPGTIKRQLEQVDLKELKDHLDESDRCANLNNIKIPWSTRAKRYFSWPFFRQKKSEQLAVQSAQPKTAEEISPSPKTMSVGSASQKAASLGIFPADMLILKDEILQKSIDGVESGDLLRIIHQYSKQSGIDISQPASDAALKQSLKKINQEAQEDFVKIEIGKMNKTSEGQKPEDAGDYHCDHNQYGQVASFTAKSSLDKDQAQKMVEAYSRLNYQGPIHVNVTSQDELEGAKAASISVSKAVVVRFNGNTYHYPSSEDTSQHDLKQGGPLVKGRSSP